MKKALVVTLCAIAACMWVEPAQACGMFIRPMHYDRDPDMSKILLVRARTFERNGKTRSALRLYERILNDEYAGKMRRATAALASYRIHKTSNDAARANARLDLAVRLFLCADHGRPFTPARLPLGTAATYRQQRPLGARAPRDPVRSTPVDKGIGGAGKAPGVRRDRACGTHRS